MTTKEHLFIDPKDHKEHVNHDMLQYSEDDLKIHHNKDIEYYHKDDVIEKNEGAIIDWHERHHDSKLEEFCDNHPDAFECRVYDE